MEQAADFAVRQAEKIQLAEGEKQDSEKNPEEAKQKAEEITANLKRSLVENVRTAAQIG